MRRLDFGLMAKGVARDFRYFSPQLAPMRPGIQINSDHQLPAARDPTERQGRFGCLCKPATVAVADHLREPPTPRSGGPVAKVKVQCLLVPSGDVNRTVSNLGRCAKQLGYKLVKVVEKADVTNPAESMA